MSPTIPIETAERALRERFGHPGFRGGAEGRQARAVAGVLAGRDVLLTLPTGAGKSLAYQLPAVLLDGLTLVVSPLIALMKDQVDALAARGVRASFVNSSLDGAERERRLAAAVRGELDLLYVTPERFRSPAFQALEQGLGVTRVAVDEAHCISQWGHDFRPDYSRLGEYLARLGSPPVIALTATATPRVADDIVRHLGMRDPLVIRAGIERPNLFLAVTQVEHAEDKLPILVELVRAIDGPGIVYSALIRDLEALHGELARAGIKSLVYHGKLSARERRAMQERFMGSEREVVLATNAFGMGVDKEDIRFVLHAQVPRTLEAWTQEIGRAGRDGEPAWCELVYFQEDVAVQQTFVEWANPTREYLLGVYETLRGWGERLQARDLDDLRDELLIKNKGDHRVQICLKWLEVLGVTEGSFETHDLTLARELDPAELPDFVGSAGKREDDLRALLAMVRFATASHSEGPATCRRAAVAAHFELAPEPVPCGGCDVCTDAPAWRAEHLAARPAVAPSPAESAEASFRRGDWVMVQGRHLGQVVKVEGEGRRIRLVVESASDLRRRTVNPRRQSVERVER